MTKTLELRLDKLEEKCHEQDAKLDFLEGENHRNWGTIETLGKAVAATSDGVSYIRGKLDEWDKRFLYRMESVEEEQDAINKELKAQKEYCLVRQATEDSRDATFSVTQKVIYGALVTILAMCASLLVKHFL